MRRSLPLTTIVLALGCQAASGPPPASHGGPHSGALEAPAPARAERAPEETTPSSPYASNQWFAEAQALVTIVVGRGCRPNLLGSDAHPFHEATAACDVYLAAALTSMAVDHPERVDAARHAVERLLAHAMSADTVRPFRSTGATRIAGRELPRSILYRGYLLLIAASAERLRALSSDADGDASDARALADALADALTEDLGASEAGFLPSFRRDLIWPCDHAPAAAALSIYGRLRSSARWQEAGRALTDRLLRRIDDPQGFPTQVDSRGRAVEPLPRGTVLAFTAGFLLHAADGPDSAAARFATVLMRDFCDDGAGACREWPRGVEREPDAVSGPIVGGYGVGASALAIGASRALDDDRWHRALVRAANEAGVTRFRNDPGQFPLENAIYLWGRSARPWLGDDR